MKRKSILLGFMLLLCTTLLVSCGGPAKEVDKKPTKVGIVLSTGGKGDKSFNDAAIRGLDKSKDEYGIVYKYVQPKNVVEDQKSLEFLAREGYELVIAVGGVMKDSLKPVAAKYPNTKFVIIDADYPEGVPSNIKCIRFKDNEGSFLAGVLAASVTNNKVVGFVGGMDQPVVRRFQIGFEAGVKAVDQSITILTAYTGTDPSAFANPDKGKEIALSMISKKADVLYHASGSTGQGVIEAASVKKGVKVIGVDSNQNWVKPGVIIASMMKRVDIAVGNVVKSLIDGAFKGGAVELLGLAQNGVHLTDLDKLTSEEIDGISKEGQEKIKKAKEEIPDVAKTRVEYFKQKIISGQLQVPDVSN